MKRSCHFLIKLLPIPTLVLLLLLGLSESLDPDYESCKPYACGGLSISFPFYVPSIQPSFCGLGKFKVSCNNKSQTIIPISGDDYIINNINYEEMSINITNSAFSNSALSCHSSIHNLTLDDDHRFNTSSFKHKYILLLHNCSRKLAASSKNYTGINCQDNEHHQGLLWAVYFEDFYPSEFGVCKNPVEVPYDEDEDESESSTSIEGLLSRGFLLKYKSLNCSHCLDSGGRCGINKTTSELLCYCPDRPHRSSCHPPTKVKKWKIILPSVLSAIVLIILALLIVYWLKRKNKSGVSTFRSTIMSFNRTITDMDGISMKGVTVFSYKELEEATHNFDPERELGEGGFGIVYYGKLKDGREVAVKRLYEKNYKRIEQFKNEIKILTDLRHDNLVTLYGCTSRHSRELLLVYEYIPNKTVADHLHSDQTKSVLLPWSTRMKIAIETATALSYLHSKEIIHRDVKTNNILLDNDFSVKVADFGLSRLFPADVTHISTAPQGTPGYVDPEYHQCYHLTDKSDVYSFGVVLVELISSLPAVDVGRHRHEINLSNYAITRIQNSAFSDLVDPNLGFERDFKVRRMTSWVAELAFQCLQHERDSRPSIEEALEVLKSIESMDYDALEEEVMSMSPRATKFMKPPPSPTDNDVVNLLRDTGRPSASPVSVMDKWLNSSKSTTPATSRSS